MGAKAGKLTGLLCSTLVFASTSLLALPALTITGVGKACELRPHKGNCPILKLVLCFLIGLTRNFPREWRTAVCMCKRACQGTETCSAGMHQLL